MTNCPEIVTDGIQSMNSPKMMESKIDPHQLSEDEFTCPMKKYLLDHNIDRACWSCDGIPVDVNKSFKDLDCYNKSIIGHKYHTKKCDICTKIYETHTCDLIEYIVGCSGQYDTISNRCDWFDFLLLVRPDNRYEGYMWISAICGKNMILGSLMGESLYPYSFFLKETELFYAKK